MSKKFSHWAAIGLVSSIGAAPLAHAGDIPCIAPQLVREDQGLGAYQNVPAAGGTFTVLVWTQSDAQCGLGVSEASDFVTDLKRTAADKWSYTVLSNQGAARTAALRGSSGTTPTSFEIRQAAASATPTPSPTPPPTATPTPSPTPTPAPSTGSALSNDTSVLGVQRSCGNVALTVVKSGAILKPGGWVLSPSRQYKLTYQADGNLALNRASGGAALWSNGKLSPGGSVKMQGDGNLVSYDTAGKPVWASNTAGKTGAFLAVQDDGNVVVYASNSCTAAWAIR